MVRKMRTTVTLEPDAEAIIRQRMKERGQTFKQAINGAIRAGARSRPRTRRLRLKTHDMGTPRIDITKATRVAADLEDHHLLASLGYQAQVTPASDEDS